MARLTSPYPKPLHDPAIPLKDWSEDDWKAWWWAFRRRDACYQAWWDKFGSKLPRENPYEISARGDAESHTVSEKILEAPERWGCPPTDYQQAEPPTDPGRKVENPYSPLWVGPDVETMLHPKPQVYTYDGISISVRSKPPTLQMDTPDGETLTLDRSRNLRTQIDRLKSRFLPSKGWRQLEIQLRTWWSGIIEKRHRPPRAALRRYLQLLDMAAQGKSQYQIADALDFDLGSFRDARREARGLARNPSPLAF